MGVLIWIGAAATLAGLAGILWCLWTVLQARRAGLPDAELRARIQGVVAINLGALGLSALGLAMVVAGILLG
jgi:hypothetical protein